MTTGHPCLKQRTRCMIVLDDGTIITGTNTCYTGQPLSKLAVCPRVTANSKSGEDYDLCGPPVHAEADAAARVPSGNEGGVAFLYGHDWMCGPCQHALIAKGIRTFVITGEPA